MAEDDKTGFLKTILGYMDRPWKVLAIIGVTFLGILAYTLYEERLDIATTVLRWYVTPGLKVSVYVKSAPELMSSTHADVTQLLKVELNSNIIRPIAGFFRTGAAWMPNPAPRALIHSSLDPQFIIDLIAGKPVCVTLPEDSVVFGVEYSTGIRRICFVPVPPLIGVMVGIVYVGWNKPLPPVEEYGATETLRNLALQIVVW